MGRHSWTPSDADLWGALEEARGEAWLSSCSRDKVGAVVLSSDGEIIGRGYNDTPGGPLCGQGGCPRADRVGLPSGAPQAPDERCYHAEAMAIAEAGPAAEGGVIVVSRQPCSWCAILIEGAGIGRVFAPPPR